MPSIPLSRITKVSRLLLQHSLSERTRNEYQGKVVSYITFCRTYHFAPWPATEETLSAFITYLFMSNQAPSTIRSTFSAIKKEQQVNRRLPWISEDAELRLRLTMKGASRSSSKPTRRASPITNRMLHSLLRTLDPSSDRHVISAAMWTTAHDGLLRISELLDLRLQDVHFFPSLIILDIHDSKAHKGQAAPEQVRLEDTGPLSAFRLLTAYFARFSLNLLPSDFFLFPSAGRRFESHAFGYKRMTIDSFDDILFAHLSFLGLSPHQLALFTTHSFRAGGATDLHLQGLSVEEIMRRGRWMSTIYKIYIREEPHEIIALLASKVRQMKKKAS